MALTSLGPLIGKLTSFIESEVSLISDDRDEIEKIKHELEIMKSFLKDAERSGAHTEVEKTWVEQVREISIEVEDIISESFYHKNRKQSQNQFIQIFNAPNHYWVRRQVGKKLQKINIKIKELSERKTRYSVDHLQARASPKKWVKDYGESSLVMENNELVGIENSKRKLLGWLLNEQHERIVISVVGMPGVGKTTLVANSFNCELVKRHFDCYAFVTVSQTCEIEDLLKTMVKEFFKGIREIIPIDLSNMTYRELVMFLRCYLQSKRYVIVLDDIWKIDVWRKINVALPDGQCGSRVLLTTRNKEIAYFSFGVRSHIHNVQPLDENESWNLFCLKAFFNRPKKQCPKEFESIARGLVQKCKGLPLGIVTLGALLSTKELELEWVRVYNNLNWELINNPDVEDVRSILLLSFNDLHYQLKCCFLYCCLFPMDYVMERSSLTMLWTAEEFVEKVGMLTPQEMADKYLMELTRRSMLQVVKREPNGEPIKFKMHDLLREFALSISQTENFCNVITSEESNKEIKARRLSYQGSNVKLESYKGLSKVRTFFVFSPSIIPSSLNAVLSRLKLVTILNLERTPIVELPPEIAQLFNLTYLNLSKTKVKKLPKSIGNLCKLETLEIVDSKIKTLPYEITKLKRLERLFVRRRDMDVCPYTIGIRAPSNICELVNLKNMGWIEVGDDLIKTLRYMTQLRTLNVANVKHEYEKDLCISIQGMEFLKGLNIVTRDYNEILCMDALLSVPPFLNSLMLCGKLEKVPHWFHSLHNITYLALFFSRLKEDFIPFVKILPNLRELLLNNTYTGDKLCFSSGFRKLSILSVAEFPQLNDIIIENGAKRCIQKLIIGNCKNLKSLPHGIKYLSTLHKLRLDNMPAKFIERIRGERSVDHYKVQHIPRITLWFKTQSGWSSEKLS